MSCAWKWILGFLIAFFLRAQIGLIWPIELMFYLPFGWTLFLWHTLPRQRGMADDKHDPRSVLRVCRWPSLPPQLDMAKRSEC